jgi:hypothetical protein
MTKIIKQLLILMTFFLSVIESKAQNFSYQTQSATNQTYVAIEDTTITPIPLFDNSYQLPIGFTFTCGGSNFDSLKIKTTGVLNFDSDYKYNFLFLNKAFLFDLDTALPSSVWHKLEVANSGYYILKIEFKNILLVEGDQKIHFNFQVWLYQHSNTIEFHMGSVSGTQPTETCMMGLINMNNTSEAAVGYLLQGDPAAPTGVSISANGDIVQLTTLPATGTIYTFTAN